MGTASKKTFVKRFSSWSNSVANSVDTDWAEQLRILNEVADLITSDLSLEEITAAIYSNVNCLLDAYQFAVGLYSEKDGTIVYKGMIEAGEVIPDFSMNAFDENRLASFCIRNSAEIFMNDIDHEFHKYLKHKPVPIAGSDPKAALYVPLKLNDKIVGLITVRTIHKNVYQQHHLHILKTVGNFILRALELAKNSSARYVLTHGSQKTWRWADKESLSLFSIKMLALLTQREKEVLLLLVTGMNNKLLAGRLFISPATIKTHTLSIYQKMDVENRSSAILKALEWGWII
ncbi:MAG: LuxR C-terminal-related transcriptional regulator [Ferruginibacter sp.]